MLTFVSNRFTANLAAARVPGAIGEIFNLGGGSPVVLTEVLDVMEEIVKRPIKRNHIERAMGNSPHTAADTSKAREFLGYEPQISLKEELILHIIY